MSLVHIHVLLRLLLGLLLVVAVELGQELGVPEVIIAHGLQVRRERVRPTTPCAADSECFHTHLVFSSLGEKSCVSQLKLLVLLSERGRVLLVVAGVGVDGPEVDRWLFF